VPFADLYGVISFYALFKTRPAGRTVLRVCNGIPCYLHGAYELGLRLQDLLGTGAGEQAPDGRVSWEWFACLGQCDHAPALLIDHEAVRGVTPAALDSIVKEAMHGPRDG
jgi:NADH:ubiquinone oxidoreductase subunit E